MSLDKLPKDILIKLILTSRKYQQMGKFINENTSYKFEKCKKCKNLYKHSKEKLLKIFCDQKCKCDFQIAKLIDENGMNFWFCDFKNCSAFEIDRKYRNQGEIYIFRNKRLSYFCKKHYPQKIIF